MTQTCLAPPLSLWSFRSLEIYYRASRFGSAMEGVGRSIILWLVIKSLGV